MKFEDLKEGSWYVTEDRQGAAFVTYMKVLKKHKAAARLLLIMYDGRHNRVITHIHTPLESNFKEEYAYRTRELKESDYSNMFDSIFRADNLDTSELP